MQYMVVERFKNGDPLPIYRRFRDKGRMMPDGLTYVSSWIDEKLSICFQLMESDDRELFDNLSAISHHELYRLAECDPDFVEGLMAVFTSSYEFNSGDTEAVKADEFPILIRVGKAEISPVKATPESKVEFIKQLTDKEKEHLNKQRSLYQKLSGEQRAKVDAFDRDLRSRPDASRRLIAMRDFHDWMQRTEMEKRNSIRDDSLDERLDWISRERVKGPAFDNIPSGDIDIILNWYEATCRKSNNQIRAQFVDAVNAYAKETGNEAPPGLKRNARREELPRLVDRLFGLDPGFVEYIFLDEDPEFVTISLEALSHQTRMKLQLLETEQVRDLVISWARSVTQSKCSISHTELNRFRDSLGEADLQRLRDLPDQEYRSELEKLYRKKNLPTRFEEPFRKLIESGGFEFN